MISELNGRAGGLCGVKPLPRKAGPSGLSNHDVVLWSDYGLSQPAADEAWASLARSDALVIVFASQFNPRLQGSLPGNCRTVALKIEADSRLLTLPGGRKVLPAASPAIATAQWTYVAELLGACRRRQRQLAVYLSIFLDPDRRRFERTKGLLFEPDVHPQPVARTEYGRQFLGTVGNSLDAIRRDEMPKIRRAAGWLAQAAAARARVVRSLQGHLPPSEPKLPGDVEFFTLTNPAALQVPGQDTIPWIRENLREGDIYLLLGYQQNEDAASAAANALGARTIFITSRGPGSEQSASPRHVYIDPHWPYTDACLELSGYDVKACPLSAILGLTCYHAICGEAVCSP